MPTYPLTVVVENWLYAIGGMNADHPVRECYVLDLSHENISWSPAPPLPVPLARLRGGVIDGVIYAVRGRFLQYRALFASRDGSNYPVLREVRVELQQKTGRK